MTLEEYVRWWRHKAGAFQRTVEDGHPSASGFCEVLSPEVQIRAP